MQAKVISLLRFALNQYFKIAIEMLVVIGVFILIHVLSMNHKFDQ